MGTVAYAYRSVHSESQYVMICWAFIVVNYFCLICKLYIYVSKWTFNKIILSHSALRVEFIKRTFYKCGKLYQLIRRTWKSFSLHRRSQENWLGILNNHFKIIKLLNTEESRSSVVGWILLSKQWIFKKKYIIN